MGKARILGSYVLTLKLFHELSHPVHVCCGRARKIDTSNLRIMRVAGVLPLPHLPHVSATSSSRSRLVQNRKYM